MEEMDGSVNSTSVASTFSKPSPPSNLRSDFDPQYIQEMNARDEHSSFYRFPSSFATNPPSTEAYMFSSEEYQKHDREENKNVYGCEASDNNMKNLNPQSAGPRSLPTANLTQSERTLGQKVVHSVPWSPMNAIGATLQGSSSRFYFFENLGQNVQDARSDGAVSSKQELTTDCDADTYQDFNKVMFQQIQQRRMFVKDSAPDSSNSFNGFTGSDAQGIHIGHDQHGMLLDRVHNPMSPSLLSRSRQSPALASIDMGIRGGKRASVTSPSALSDELCFRGLSEDAQTPYVGLTGQSLETLMFASQDAHLKVEEEMSEAKVIRSHLL